MLVPSFCLLNNVIIPCLPGLKVSRGFQRLLPFVNTAKCVLDEMGTWAAAKVIQFMLRYWVSKLPLLKDRIEIDLGLLYNPPNLSTGGGLSGESDGASDAEAGIDDLEELLGRKVMY